MFLFLDVLLLPEPLLASSLLLIHSALITLLPRMLKTKLRSTPLIWVQASFRNLMSSFFHQTPLQKHYEGLAVGIRILRSPLGICESLFCPTGLYAFCHARKPNIQEKINSLHSCYSGKSRYTGASERRCWLEAIRDPCEGQVA